MHLRAFGSICLLSLLSVFCLAGPASASEVAASEKAPPSEKLRDQLVTDEKIAELCQASIKYNYDLIDAVDENGSARKVPRCVANYEAMRSVANTYLKQEEFAKTEITTAIATCEEAPDQAACLDAGRKLTAKAADLHENLSQTAETALEQLAGSAGRQ